ncbi:MAG: ABC transporter ATP-binding protein [Acutalibacteraceae bacterium]|nr:ABC transporter ATP-binding protein [Oscillospiraceae bacterium]
MNDIIKIENLKKSYGRHVVLDDISLSLGENQIVGLLGPNGCGKTTLIKTMTGLIKDYEGSVIIDGEKPGVHTKSIISYLPEKSYLPDWMRPIDALKYFADFYSDFDMAKAEKMIRDFELDSKQKIKTMSKGQQEKISLILVMSRKAKLYILDEPLGGVDPAARDAILSLIMNNYAESSTVLMSTHLIHDIEPVLDRALMISKGKLVLNADVEKIKEGGRTVEDIFKEVFAYAW